MAVRSSLVDAVTRARAATRGKRSWELLSRTSQIVGSACFGMVANGEQELVQRGCQAGLMWGSGVRRLMASCNVARLRAQVGYFLDNGLRKWH